MIATETVKLFNNKGHSIIFRSQGAMATSSVLKLFESLRRWRYRQRLAAC